MKAKNTVAKKPTTVHSLYSSPMTLKVRSAPHAIRTATTMKFSATCCQNSCRTLNLSVCLAHNRHSLFWLFLFSEPLWLTAGANADLVERRRHSAAEGMCPAGS